jgi:hypothetical protein
MRFGCSFLRFHWIDMKFVGGPDQVYFSFYGQICLFRLFRYGSETPKQTEKIIF